MAPRPPKLSRRSRRRGAQQILWNFQEAIPPSRQQPMSNCGCASGDKRAFEDDGEAIIRFEPIDRYEEERNDYDYR